MFKTIQDFCHMFTVTQCILSVLTYSTRTSLSSYLK